MIRLLNTNDIDPENFGINAIATCCCLVVMTHHVMMIMIVMVVVVMVVFFFVALFLAGKIQIKGEDDRGEGRSMAVVKVVSGSDFCCCIYNSLRLVSLVCFFAVFGRQLRDSFVIPSSLCPAWTWLHAGRLFLFVCFLTLWVADEEEVPKEKRKKKECVRDR